MLILRYQSRIASPQKSAITPPSARKGPSGIAFFRASRPWRTNSTRAGTNARKNPETRAEERRQLDVPHAEPARIDEHDQEEQQPRAESAQDPLDARVVDRPQAEDENAARQDDLVGNETRLEVGTGDDHENPAEDSGSRSLEREAEYEPARSTEEGGTGHDEPQARRARDRPDERIVARSIRREPVGDRADDDPHDQANETRSDVHDTRFPDGGSLPPERQDRRGADPSLG